MSVKLAPSNFLKKNMEIKLLKSIVFDKEIKPIGSIIVCDEFFGQQLIDSKRGEIFFESKKENLEEVENIPKKKKIFKR